MQPGCTTTCRRPSRPRPACPCPATWLLDVSSRTETCFEAGLGRSRFEHEPAVEHVRLVRLLRAPGRQPGDLTVRLVRRQEGGADERVREARMAPAAGCVVLEAVNGAAHSCVA